MHWSPRGSVSAFPLRCSTARRSNVKVEEVNRNGMHWSRPYSNCAPRWHHCADARRPRAGPRPRQMRRAPTSPEARPRSTARTEGQAACPVISSVSLAALATASSPCPPCSPREYEALPPRWHSQPGRFRLRVQHRHLCLPPPTRRARCAQARRCARRRSRLRREIRQDVRQVTVREGRGRGI